MKQILWMDRQALDLNWDADSDDAKISVARHHSPRKISKLHRSYFWYIPNCTIGYQANRPKSGKNGRHDFTTVRRIIRKWSDFLEYHNCRLRGLSYRCIQVDKFTPVRLTLRHRLNVGGNSIPHHSSKFREQA